MDRQRHLGVYDGDLLQVCTYTYPVGARSLGWTHDYGVRCASVVVRCLCGCVGVVIGILFSVLTDNISISTCLSFWVPYATKHIANRIDSVLFGDIIGNDWFVQ
eukprot:220386_1